MGSGRGRNERREDQAHATHVQQIQQWQPTPVETRQNERILGFINDVDSGKDVKDISYLKPYFNLYENAKGAQNAERMGSGALNLGGEGNANMVNRLREVHGERRAQDAAGQLSNAYNAAYADATGNQIPFLTGLSENRHAGKTGATGSLYSTILNRPRQQPFWQQLLMGGMQAAGTVAGAAL